MKTTDRFLIGIVAGVVLLVVAAFATALLRPKPTYQPEDTPEGVSHNYLFALQQKDDTRAYGYLSRDIAGYPDSHQAFAEDVDNFVWYFDQESSTLQVEPGRIDGNEAEVTVRETRFYGGGLFNSSQSTSTFTMRLRRDLQGAWKIVEADSYWAWCWNESDGCR